MRVYRASQPFWRAKSKYLPDSAPSPVYLHGGASLAQKPGSRCGGGDGGGGQSAAGEPLTGGRRATGGAAAAQPQRGARESWSGREERRRQCRLGRDSTETRRRRWPTRSRLIFARAGSHRCTFFALCACIWRPARLVDWPTGCPTARLADPGRSDRAGAARTKPRDDLGAGEQQAATASLLHRPPLPKQRLPRFASAIATKVGSSGRRRRRSRRRACSA